MVTYRKLVPSTDTLENIQPGDNISYPRDAKWCNMIFLYTLIAENAYTKLQTLTSISDDEWTWNRLLVILSPIDKLTSMAHAIYKHDEQHYFVTIYHSAKYVDSL